MKIYNITFVVEKSIVGEWKRWLENTHLQTVLSTGCFSYARVTKICTETDPNSVNFSVQFFAEKAENVVKYLENHATKMKQDVLKSFGSRVLFFETEMNLIGDFYYNSK